MASTVDRSEVLSVLTPRRDGVVRREPMCFSHKTQEIPTCTEYRNHIKLQLAGMHSAQISRVHLSDFALDLVSAKLPTLRTFSGIGEASHAKARAVAFTRSSAWARDASFLASERVVVNATIF